MRVEATTRAGQELTIEESMSDRVISIAVMKNNQREVEYGMNLLEFEY